MFSNADSEILLCGVVYFVISLSQIPLYIVVMLAFYRKDCQKPNMTFKLINLISFWQLAQTVGHFVTSPIFIFPELQAILPTTFRMIGCLMNVFYLGQLPSIALLAVCRILVFRQSMSTDRMPMGVKLLLVLGVLSQVAMFILLFGFETFILKPPTWGFNFEIPLSSTIADVQFCVYLSALSIAYVSYVTIVAMIVWKRNSTSNTSNATYRNELSIMIQFTLLTVYDTSQLIFWNRASFWFNVDTIEIQAAINFVWIFGAYVSPVSIIIFNRKIRTECARIIGLRSARISANGASTTTDKMIKLSTVSLPLPRGSQIVPE